MSMVLPIAFAVSCPSHDPLHCLHVTAACMPATLLYPVCIGVTFYRCLAHLWQRVGQGAATILVCFHASNQKDVTAYKLGWEPSIEPLERRRDRETLEKELDHAGGLPHDFRHRNKT
eukprot:TRINITY_DN42388_c0_g1_i1.p1 TRINITY_DN42388_c0_g1~~TRINITY_DN42388_c0_g1_i1.p1  ORF type:complete len:117 (+),score=4.85 TRINITY_DN42388_c0_g1_i1:149-499(+)